MSQSPVTVTYSLEDILTKLEGKIDKQFEEMNRKIDKIDERFDKVDERFDKVDERLNKLEIKLETGHAEIRGDIKALDEKVNGLSKRLEFQEFINRGVFLALIVTVLGGFAKLFGFWGNP